jgi:hypothetical protein
VSLASPAATIVSEDPVVAEGLATTMLRIGLTPDALAAAGCSSADVTSAAGYLNTHLLDDESAIPAADAAWASANNAVQDLKRAIKGGEATEEEIGGLAALESTLASASAARDALLDEAFAVAAAALSLDEKADVLTIRGNSSWGLAAHFLVVDRSQEDWVALRDALDEERIAAKYSEAVSAGSQALLSAARGNADVAAAKTNLDINLAAITAAWDSATS